MIFYAVNWPKFFQHTMNDGSIAENGIPSKTAI